jgi:hypothetical protein
VAAGDQGAHHPIEEPDQPVGWVHALNGRRDLTTRMLPQTPISARVTDTTRSISLGSRPLASSPGVVMRRRRKES